VHTRAQSHIAQASATQQNRSPDLQPYTTCPSATINDTTAAHEPVVAVLVSSKEFARVHKNSLDAAAERLEGAARHGALHHLYTLTNFKHSTASTYTMNTKQHDRSARPSATPIVTCQHAPAHNCTTQLSR
jgi:hypothetical protein